VGAFVVCRFQPLGTLALIDNPFCGINAQFQLLKIGLTFQDIVNMVACCRCRATVLPPALELGYQFQQCSGAVIIGPSLLVRTIKATDFNQLRETTLKPIQSQRLTLPAQVAFLVLKCQQAIIATG